MSNLAANLARAGNTKGDDIDAAAKHKGKLIARVHDEVNFVLVLGLVAGTVYCFVVHSPFHDALQSRVASAERLGFSGADAPGTPPIYFWLDPVAEAPGWHTPGCYWWLTVAAFAYSVFDTGYMLVQPRCTTKASTVVPHHLATMALTAGALWFGVEPLTAHCMLVELNTMALTMKNIKRSPAQDLGLLSNTVRATSNALHDLIGEKIIHPFFLASWVGLRLNVYPFLLLTFHRFFGHARFAGAGYAYTLGALLALNVLNQVWTYEIMGGYFVVGVGAATAAALCFA